MSSYATVGNSVNITPYRESTSREVVRSPMSCVPQKIKYAPGVLELDIASYLLPALGIPKGDPKRLPNYR
jgi:hypothetical protein